MTVPDEKFFAWLDGELPPQEAALVEAEIAKSPELSRAAEQHRRMQARMKAAFDRVAEAPLPKSVRHAVPTKDAEVVDFASARRPRRTRDWSSPVRWAAMAASLVIGVLGGVMIAGRSDSPVEIHGGRLYAAAALNQALDAGLASAPGDGPVRIGLTFRNQSGAICRTFISSQSSGLACREGARWQVRGLFTAPEGQNGAYRMAGSMDPNLAALVDSTIVGEAFDAEQERAAKLRDWR